METTLRRSALKRRFRNPKGHLTGREMELAILELLRDNRYSATPYIKAAVGNVEYVENVLPDLVEKHYIGIPAKAVDRCKTKAVPHVYELLPRGLDFLKAHDRHIERHTAGNWFEHDFLTCCHKFSFEHSTRTIRGFVLRTPKSILEHDNCPPSTTNFVIPTDPALEYDLDLFGLEYLPSARKLFCFVETDTGTHKRDDVKDKIRRSVEFLERKMGAKLFGFPTKFELEHFFYITNTEDRLEDFAGAVPTEWSDRFHFKWTDKSFDTKFPPATAHMVLEPWTQSDGSTWSILEHLEVDDVRQAESGAHQNASDGD